MDRSSEVDICVAGFPRPVAVVRKPLPLALIARIVRLRVRQDRVPKWKRQPGSP